MKTNLLGIAAGMMCFALACCTDGKDSQTSCTKDNATAEEKAAIVAAIDCYIEGGRQGSSEVARKGFAPTATMSWYEDGQLQSVPIQTLYDGFDATNGDKVSYEMTLCEVAGDVAVVRIESQFGEARYTDMFSLVKDREGWKIVSKIYHVK